jgi:hypothetical protein
MVRMLLEMLPGPDFTLTVTGSPEEATGVVMAKGAFPKVLSAMEELIELIILFPQD